MKILPSIISVSLLIAVLSIHAFSQTEARISKTWEVQRYDLTATLPAAETDRNLTAAATLNLRNASGSPVTSLTLRISPRAEVSAVNINNAAAEFTKGEEKVGSGTLQRIIMRGFSVPAGGNLTVKVNYKLKVDENSGLNALSPAGSQFLPLSFWYPTPNSWYFTRGADYAPVRLAAAANGQTIVSSGTLKGDSYEQNLNVQPFFVTGNWDSINAGGVTVYLPKGAGPEEQKRGGELASLLSEAKNYTTNLLGPVDDSALKIVAVRRGSGFSAGGTILVDENVLRRQKIDSLTAMTIAEAAAKMWFSGAARVDGEGGGAIREGLSRFIATQFLESKYGKEIADLERMRQRTAYAAVVRRDAALSQISPLDDAYFTASANKGAMIWRLLAKKLGTDNFFGIIREQLKSGSLDLPKLRGAFSAQKDLLDYSFDQVTDMDLLIGLPLVEGGQTKMNLRNTGSIDAAVEVKAWTDKGETLSAQTVIPAKNFGVVSFPTVSKIVRAEVDSEKLYPQIGYSDDAAPREIDESDLLLFVKRNFDKQDFAGAEKNARLVLRSFPRYDDVRVLLGRSLLALGRTAEAEKEFQAVLDEKLPTARSLAWANVGLGEVALKNNQSAAVRFFDEAVKADAEYGATLAARQGKIRGNAPIVNDESIKGFFAQFDKAAVSSSKANLDALILSGEIPRFSGGIAGQAQEWTTRIVQIEKSSPTSAVVETNLNIKMLNKNPETGTAVYRLTLVGNNWKLSGVDMFEVR